MGHPDSSRQIGQSRQFYGLMIGSRLVTALGECDNHTGYLAPIMGWRGGSDGTTARPCGCGGA